MKQSELLKNRKHYLNQERKDRLSTLGVAGELLLVQLVLADGPHGHLVESSQGKESS
jgi:hypothetical protein